MKKQPQLQTETNEDTYVQTSLPKEVQVEQLPKLVEVDRMVLELAKSRRQTALAEAKTALAQNDNAELSYKYVVLQLYMKYGLTDRDAISENGDIIKNGAVQPVPPGV